MDTSQMRSSRNVEDYRNAGIGSQVFEGASRVLDPASAVSNIAGKFTGGQQAKDQDTLAQKAEPGSMSEQAGVNNISTDSGALPFNDRFSGSEGFNVNDALSTIDQVMQHGYAKAGLGGQQDQGQQDQGAIPDQSAQSDQSAQGFDEGGPVQDPNGNDAQPAEQGAIPEQPQQDQPQQPGLLQQAGQAFKTLAPPMPGGAQGAKFIASMLQSIGAMPIPQAQQLEHQTGESDPNMAKLKAAHELAQSQGPDAAWSYLQSLRKQYDFNRTNAAVKANQGNLAQSTEAATHAMTNILDGTKTHFTPTPDGKGVKVVVHKIGGQ